MKVGIGIRSTVGKLQ